MKERIPDKLRQDVADMVRSVWWVRCLLETENGRLGMILRAAMAKPTESPPWFGPSAIIDNDGWVLTNYVDDSNKQHFACVACHIDDLVNNLRDLAGLLRLADHEAEALFAAIRAWIKEDARPHTEQAQDRVPIEYRSLN